MNVIKTIVQFPFLLLIKIYQYVLSPIWPASCRFEPTCSHYAAEAIKKRGIFVGMYLGIKRIARCHPWGGMGYDPVPEKKKKS
ncbi:MAG: membrane protein insertion efficiency factor YidD [Flavobacteriales bacterium]